MNRHASLFVSLPLAACAAGGTPAPATPSTEPAPSPAAPAREASFTWVTGGAEAGGRRYRLYVPASYDPARATPLLVMLHGCTQDPDDLARGTRMNEVAGERGLLVVYPEQTAAGHPQKCWSWYDPAHQERGRGEPAAIAAIAREVMASHRVDPARVYVAGVSAGGAMALTAAATHPELFAAAGSHSGPPYRSAVGVQEALQVMQRGAASSPALATAAAAARGAGAPALPVILFHGGVDPVVRAVNAEHATFQWAEAAALAGRSLRLQAEATPPAPAAAASADTAAFEPRVRRFVDERGTVVVETWVVPGLGHAWSGGSPEGTFTEARGPDASREMVRFFLEHPRETR